MRYLIVFLVLLAVSSGSGIAQDSQAPPSLSARAERGLQRSDLAVFLKASKAGSTQVHEVGLAIISAGKTNDPFWIPYLKPFLKYARDPNQSLSELAGVAQLALAKLGERKQLQQIACEAEFGSASVQYDAVRSKLRYIDGWFSIHILARWLDVNYKFQPLLYDQPSDVLYLRPQELALKELPQIVPHPPFSPPLPIWLETRNENELAPRRMAWLAWIKQNEESLRRLAPTDEGIDDSESACKRVLKNDQLFDRSHLR